MARNSLPQMHVVTTANAFAKTGELLLEERPEGTDWLYPFVVNVALSIELYLKSYLAEEDLIPFLVHEDGSTTYQRFTKCIAHDHRFDKLYAKIPAHIKSKIESEFRGSLLKQKFPAFEDALNKFSNSFVEARYPYEKGGFKGGWISDLMNISVFLKNTIFKIGEIRDA
ncbi:hypothetical protein [Ideonella livida]|uniref:Uncharacterized protein n=1 Tax=Ideonella livida TaxID=2707176 RepID=A0A7C9TM51_9BURK|nr:hypothetical protein [Ideonella livida]NDY92445.1 hypothetical protein [Ideonella livida]